jgi:hypothetical protein
MNAITRRIHRIKKSVKVRFCEPASVTACDAVSFLPGFSVFKTRLVRMVGRLIGKKLANILFEDQEICPELYHKSLLG